ncbi:MAG: OmpA family protein [Myxococcota bacterium]
MAGAGDAFDYKIFFAAGSDEVRPESAAILDELAEELAEHPEAIGIRVVGHVDRTEDGELSKRRADAVAAALRKRGVSQRLHARGAGAGEGRPSCTDDPELCLARSRRVEFVVVVSE